MDHRRLARGTALASLLVVAVVAVVTVVGTAAGTTVATEDRTNRQRAGSPLDTIEQILQRIDAFLETIADLLRTIRTISSEGGGDYIGGQDGR